MYNQLLEFIGEFNTLYDIQFSFGKFHAIIMAFDLAVNHIKMSYTLVNAVLVYVLDLQAFNTLNHDILFFFPLNHWGIRALYWQI